MFDFLKGALITEKSTKLIEQKQYSFIVDSVLTKKQIRKIFQKFYGIQIEWVKTQRINFQRKKKAIIKFIKPILE